MPRHLTEIKTKKNLVSRYHSVSFCRPDNSTYKGKWSVDQIIAKQPQQAGLSWELSKQIWTCVKYEKTRQTFLSGFYRDNCCWACLWDLPLPSKKPDLSWDQLLWLMTRVDRHSLLHELLLKPTAISRTSVVRMESLWFSRSYLTTPPSIPHCYAGNGCWE